MRFGMLCDDSSVSPIVDGLSAQVDGHQLNYAVRITDQADHLLHNRPTTKFVNHWEDLLVTNSIDAIVVGGSDAQILEGTKQLATAGFPILFAPQANQGSTFVYELSLIRDDNHVSLYPILWHRFDAAVIHLRSALVDGRLGRIQFLQLNRCLTRPTASTPIASIEVDAELLLDADLMRWLVGDYDQVTSLLTAATTDGVLMQSVVLAGRSLPEANWSVSPTIKPEQWRLEVRGEKGTAELRRELGSHNWICEIEGQHVEGDAQATARSLISAFVTATVNDKSAAGSQSHSVSSEWGDLVKCFETIDAMHRSIRRRRTIEMHFEPMSERAIFKTQMTAIGCGLLVATFFLTLAYLGIASLIPLPSGVLIGLRTLVFAPLVVFLVAQILLPLTRRSSSERS